ncbi:hypothetical protein [Nocardia gipuzkoensis]|uniref:hypothetical protein n=1 Tax=Nocardia gipuzkoensis TaxID=2749991 RepID=UPI003EE15593
MGQLRMVSGAAVVHDDFSFGMDGARPLVSASLVVTLIKTIDQSTYYFNRLCRPAITLPQRCDTEEQGGYQAAWNDLRKDAAPDNPLVNLAIWRYAAATRMTGYIRMPIVTGSRQVSDPTCPTR